MCQNEKQIWIVSYYDTHPNYTSNPRHIEFARYLINNGYNVTIFCANNNSQVNEKNGERKSNFILTKCGPYNFCFINVLKYSGNSIQRGLSIFQFAWRIFLKRKMFPKPDIIIHNIHEPFDYPVLWCARKMKAKYIVEDWDLWAHSFVRCGFFQEESLIARFIFYIQKRLFQKADRIIFTFEGGADYIKNKKWDKSSGGIIDLAKVSYINNGVNNAEFNENIVRYQLCDPDLNNETSLKVIYVGSIQLVNDIMKLIEAAALLKQHHNIKFLIYGDGVDRDHLIHYCQENRLDNILFKEKWLPLHNIPYILSKSTVNILNYKPFFGEYGISSGKFFQYLAAGKPICCNISIMHCLISKYQLGIAKDFSNSQEYANAIFSLVNMPHEEYHAMCCRVVKVAAAYDYRVLSELFMHVIKEV